ncbi:hypothetical protein GCM10010911_15780 [Paenibacillus nasutitermitis]|uniref:Transposase n=1 Tax=Paenibacillus nasutitermitis TaxID=1652958 RepID=A0A917DPX2_9BACL|nr:hypothetical protein GCM10010911_15780 [Paenibacillus nasutitermitis]
MNFKAQDKQNQRIENITVHHLVVGVDIAQEVHVARAVSFRGIALGTPLEFGNHREGFTLFENWIQDLLSTSLQNRVLEPPKHFMLTSFILGNCLKNTT